MDRDLKSAMLQVTCKEQQKGLMKQTVHCKHFRNIVVYLKGAH